MRVVERTYATTAKKPKGKIRSFKEVFIANLNRVRREDELNLIRKYRKW